jgi:hypothetical protein
MTTGGFDTPGETAGLAAVRWNWLKGMYVANVVVSGPLGLATLLAPEAVRRLLGVPAGDPIHFGIATGAVPLAFAIAGLAGLRAPLRFSPILGVQAVYKTLCLVGVVAPLALGGSVPAFAVPIVVIFLGFVVGDLVALPTAYLLAEPDPSMERPDDRA